MYYRNKGGNTVLYLFVDVVGLVGLNWSVCSGQEWHVSVCLFSWIKNIPSFKCWSIDQLNSIFNDIICSSAKSLDPVLRYWHSPSINFSMRGQLSHSLLRHGSDHLHIRSYQCHVIFHLQIVLNVCFKIEIKNCYRL